MLTGILTATINGQVIVKDFDKEFDRLSQCDDARVMIIDNHFSSFETREGWLECIQLADPQPRRRYMPMPFFPKRPLDSDNDQDLMKDMIDKMKSMTEEGYREGATQYKALEEEIRQTLSKSLINIEPMFKELKESLETEKGSQAEKPKVFYENAENCPQKP